MKNKIFRLIPILLLISAMLSGCSKEDPAKAVMQAKVGENQRMTGVYDEALAAACHNGTFVGVNENGVISYKGIPYARPPVGDLRWKRPILAQADSGVYEAYYFGKSPIQSEWPSEVGSYYQQGEDCLTLNVWTNPSGPTEGKTVMVFFHGGSYGWGATSDPIYDGHNLVEKYPDLVLVTVEYRTGIIGFIDFSEVPGGEEFAASGNLGLLDQICALQWVQRNIAAFGGDPNNVTIFGESAGAGSVSLLPLIEGTDGLFQRIIAESGSVALTYSVEECQNLTNLLLENSGCSNMEELMALSEEELMDLNEELNDYNNFPERDGVILPADLYSAWEQENHAAIDMMIGTNADEVRYWIREMGYYTKAIPGVTIYRHGFPILYENNLKQLTSEEKESVSQFLSLQHGRKIWKLTELYNELLFRIPAAEQAGRHADSGGRSYTYYWTMGGADSIIGACHAIELSYVFNNPQETIYTGNVYNEGLAGSVQDMWVSFARSGNPSTADYTWEPYTRDSRMTMVLGEDIHMESDLKADQRVLIEPLLGHYFNGCYSQMSLQVPQLLRIVIHLAAALALIINIVVRTISKHKNKQKARSKS